MCCLPLPSPCSYASLRIKLLVHHFQKLVSHSIVSEPKWTSGNSSVMCVYSSVGILMQGSQPCQGSLVCQPACLPQDWSDPSEFLRLRRICTRLLEHLLPRKTSPRGVEDHALQRYLRWLATGATTEPQQRKPRAKATAGEKRTSS